jgi:hypothetical protein
MSRHELIAVVKHQAGQIAELFDTNEVLTAKLARLEHLLSRNSRNSSLPPSKDDDLGKKQPRRSRNSVTVVGPSVSGASSRERRAADVGFQLGDAAVGRAAEFAVGQLGEPAFDEVEPGGAGGGEVQVEAAVPRDAVSSR